MAQLPPRDQRHPWLLYEGQEYTDEVIQDFKERLGRIFTRQVHWLYVLDLGALTKEMGQAITNRHRMGHIKADGQRQFILALGLHTVKEMAINGFRAYWAESSRVIAYKADLSDYWTEIEGISNLTHKEGFERVRGWMNT
nr:hypothetical protein [Tanacetum cinerariifolium]